MTTLGGGQNLTENDYKREVLIIVVKEVVPKRERLKSEKCAEGIIILNENTDNRIRDSRNAGLKLEYVCQ